MCLTERTAYTPLLVKTALDLLKRIYREGYEYKKAGVALMDIAPGTEHQLGLYERNDLGEHTSLMEAIDSINGKWGRETVRSGAAGYKRPWSMKRGRLSPEYTTSWDGILRVK